MNSENVQLVAWVLAAVFSVMLINIFLKSGWIGKLFIIAVSVTAGILTKNIPLTVMYSFVASLFCLVKPGKEE